MSTLKVVLYTGWGARIGTGHLQRMASLLSCNREREDVLISLVTPEEPSILEEDDRYYWRYDIPEGTDVILHDFRDSDPLLIRDLKSRAQVVLIDDHGPGRKEADALIDLLPFPGQDTAPDPDIFLYGYTFSRNLERMKNISLPDPEGILVYPGVLAGNSRMLSLIKELERYYPLKGSGSAEGTSQLAERPMAELILSVKVVLTYFGITLYEALLCERPVVTVNPTSYHDELTGMLEQLTVFNTGIAERVREENLLTTVRAAMSGKPDRPETDKLVKKIRGNRHRFLDRIISFI